MIGINNDDIQLVSYEEFSKDWVPRFMSHHSQLQGA